MIRFAEPSDATAVAAIYNHYVANTTITFEEEEVSPATMRDRIRAVQALSLPWLVLEEADSVLGYAYASPWRDRSAYRFTVESTVYLHPDSCGRGNGSALLSRVIEGMRETGAHVVIAAIALPNPASVSLHERFGFTKVAHFAEVGFKFGAWIDVGSWELRL